MGRRDVGPGRGEGSGLEHEDMTTEEASIGREGEGRVQIVYI